MENASCGISQVADSLFYFRRWGAMDAFSELEDRLVQKARLKRGETAAPTIGAIDSASVRSALPGSQKGIDGNKKVKGVNRNIITDKDGDILALNGDVMAAEAAKRCLAKCRSLMPNNTVIRVWIGKNSTDMMNCLIKNTESNLENRSLLAGSVNKYERGSAAYIRKQELDMDIFFKPDRNGLNSSCLNHDVSFHLGVSYDGLIAENVSLIIE